MKKLLKVLCISTLSVLIGLNSVDAKELDINSDLVKQLYDYINIDGWNERLKYNSNISATNLNQELINYIAYRQIPTSKIKFAFCSQYPSVTSTRICGKADDAQEGANGTYDSTNSSTTIIEEVVLKEYVEKIFGENSYKRVPTFGIYDCPIDHIKAYTGYQYDDSGVYVFFDGMVGCNSLYPEKSVVNVSENNGVISIIENQKLSGYGEYDYNIYVKYTFTLDKNTNEYHFTNVEKVDYKVETHQKQELKIETKVEEHKVKNPETGIYVYVGVGVISLILVSMLIIKKKNKFNRV